MATLAPFALGVGRPLPRSEAPRPSPVLGRCSAAPRVSIAGARPSPRRIQSRTSTPPSSGSSRSSWRACQSSRTSRRCDGGPVA